MFNSKFILERIFMSEVNENSIVRFNDGNFELDVRVSPDEDTV